MEEYFVYILANKKKGTLYIGMTNDLERRMREHKLKEVKGFTKKYNITRLVYFESCFSNNDVFIRERQMKKWKREWKINRIIEMNPEWEDLSAEWG